MHTPDTITKEAKGLLALTLAPGMGPVRIARVLGMFGSFERVLAASAAEIARVPGMGTKTASALLTALKNSDQAVERELETIGLAGASILTIADAGYPSLLKHIPAAPPVLCVRGQLQPNDADRYTVSIVGSRKSTHYGIEQSTRFSGALARAGMTMVSGGARGIDTAAHRGAMDAGGRTIAVLGCGIAKCYPPENAALFDRIADGNGAVISELPANTGPNAENFPARNRIISGLSLGVIVIEAGRKSGALITARHAADDHGREVMGIPGRVDSPASEGTHDLLKQGAHLITDPADVLSILEGHARHLHAATHDAITNDPTRTSGPPELFDSTRPPPTPIGNLDDTQSSILAELDEARTADELGGRCGLDAGTLRAQLTMLEIAGHVRRTGSRFERAR
ncbi:MAG: DNA-processing protein DprA [Phycisphaerales bacterium]